MEILISVIIKYIIFSIIILKIIYIYNLKFVLCLIKLYSVFILKCQTESLILFKNKDIFISSIANRRKKVGSLQVERTNT